ncbi:MAG: phage tail protein [Fimbriimonadaceae bacterium]
MSNPYIGEIRVVGFNFPPSGWAFCNGAILPITQYEALYNLVGTTYGGDGQTTFALPDLQGRVPIHQGTDEFGNTYVIGEAAGVESVTLNVAEIPAHAHGFAVSNAVATTNVPSQNFVATAPFALGNTFSTAAPNSTMAAAITPTGGNVAHTNIQPFLALNYIFSLFGIFPSQG